MTPGFLRGHAANQIVGIMHTAAGGGPWAAETMRTEVVSPVGEKSRVRTTIVFAVGTLYEQDARSPDMRETVTITIEESSGR